MISIPDLSATILDMAGVEIPTYFDGTSFLDNAYIRRYNLIEYHGETNGGGSPHSVCELTSGPAFNDLYCTPANNFTTPPYWMGAGLCVCQDALNNTYSCLRGYTPGNSTNGISFDYRYCEYSMSQQVVEFFNYTEDPYELENKAETLLPAFKTALHLLLAEAVTCIGAQQCTSVLSRKLH